MNNYQLQGTDGCYESSRGGQYDKDKLWLRKLSKDIVWTDLNAFQTVAELAEKYMPEIWREAGESAKKAGHGGGDYFEIIDFIDAIQGIRAPVIGIHEAMDMTLPGLVSQLSIADDSRWMEVPDSRTW